MQEALLQYIWQQALYDKKEYLSDTNERIQIVSPGIQNRDGGPDFANAKIKIADTLWVGNVEIHQLASDWNKHGHNKQGNYSNVILHVVDKIDGETFCENGRKIPGIELKFPIEFRTEYSKLIESGEQIACGAKLVKLDKMLLSFWFSALAVERLNSKTNTIEEYLKRADNNWEEVFYTFLLRSFGMKVNSQPFEMLARATPLKILAKHSNSLFQLEALLFGQAGFLEEEALDQYQSELHIEYNYLKHKYQLKNIDAHLWKFLRLRPSNFPTIRIAQLCTLILNSRGLFSKLIECKEIKEIEALLKTEVSAYWKTHFVFGKETLSKYKKLGRNTIHSLIINTIVPFLFIYGEAKNNQDLKDAAIRFLEQLPAEDNTVLRKWKEYSIIPRHAADSQALLQLTQHYCDKKRCIECQIGNLVLRRSHT